MGVGVIAVVEELDLAAHAMRAAGEFMVARDQSGDREERVQRLVEVLKEEKDKIQVFQRELPFTMQILTDVMEGFRKEVERRRRKEEDEEEERLKELSSAQVLKSGEKPVVKLEKESLLEKTDWLSSAQLWVDNPSSSNTASREKSSDEGGEKWTSNYQAKLMPFPSQWSIGRGMNGERQQEEEQRVSKLTIAVAGFTRMPPPPAMSAGSSGPVVAYRGADAFDLVSPVTVSSGGSIGLQVPSQQHRKARRCWSPELHRLFVSALNQLGGAQVATPKQIRELMKVDGLTNDEVKSHLQKYRLHNRRVPNGITAVSGNRPMGLMDALLGTTSEHGTASSQQSISQSASPKDMHQFTASGRTASTNAGDSCEEEDVKSESYNWK